MELADGLLALLAADCPVTPGQREQNTPGLPGVAWENAVCLLNTAGVLKAEKRDKNSREKMLLLKIPTWQLCFNSIN